MPLTKLQSLRASGTFNPRAAQVRHPLFVPGDFFDPRDLVQLKYETLRALQKDDYSIAQAAAQFGLSRPTIYDAQAHRPGAAVSGSSVPAAPGAQAGGTGAAHSPTFQHSSASTHDREGLARQGKKGALNLLNVPASE